jgi:lactoylglutathione lyase
MIELNGLAHIGIRVADFGRSVRFYRQFGFKVIREDLNERVVVLHHEQDIELNLLDSANDSNEGKNVLMDEYPRYPGFTHMAIEITDHRHAVKILNEMDISITEGPVTFGDGSTSIFFRDPDRNVIEFSEALKR